MVHQTNYKSLGHRKVLVVDDIEMNQQLAKHIMQSWGFTVDVAANGREAVEKVEKNTYDLVLMDIQMPEMDGMQATESIRRLKDAAKAATPIVALTANLLNGEGDRYLQKGMNDYLPKPLDEQRLFQLVSKNLVDCPDSIFILEPLQNETAESIPTEKLYDLTMIHGLSGGDESFIRQMVELFVDTMPGSVEEMQTTLEQKQWDALGKLAHKLKSTTGSMGMDSIKDEIRAVEQNCKKNENLEATPALAKKVILVINQTVAQLKIDFSLAN
ncbi:MAG: response regulator [Chitinophagaceae bacterium]|nr:response regulator [Chitinophagaceae bacterium]